MWNLFKKKNDIMGQQFNIDVIEINHLDTENNPNQGWGCKYYEGGLTRYYTDNSKTKTTDLYGINHCPSVYDYLIHNDSLHNLYYNLLDKIEELNNQLRVKDNSDNYIMLVHKKIFNEINKELNIIGSSYTYKTNGFIPVMGCKLYCVKDKIDDYDIIITTNYRKYMKYCLSKKGYSEFLLKEIKDEELIKEIPIMEKQLNLT